VGPISKFGCGATLEELGIDIKNLGSVNLCP